MKEYDILIIGSGASGSFCASCLNCTNKKIAMIDCCDVIAKKLLVTGNGKCNLTNMNLSKENYNTDVSKFFDRFNNLQTLEKFKEIGLCCYSDEEGRVYPISNSSQSVLKVLTNSIKQKNIDYFTAKVEKILKINDNFEVYFEKEVVKAKKIVIACGKNFFDIETNFKIETSNLMPSLVALKTKEKTKKLDGQRLSSVEVKAIVNNKEKIQKGELLFKDNGLSGICIFNLSTLFAREKNFDGEIYIDILPNFSKQELFNIIENNSKKFNSIFDALCGILQPKVVEEILFRAKIDKDAKSILLQSKDFEEIVSNIKCLKYNVVSHYENNQVYSGGVKLETLTDNLESKQIENLYFIGEVCDVDGDCGGYNLQWAWTSAKLVADDINGIE